ncbi:MAG: RhuM family protein, partial [Flavobacteriales bacterium]
MKNEIIIYHPDNLTERIEVKMEDETVWLSLNQIATLFDRDKSVISKHLKNIFKEEELMKNSVVAFFATTASDGKTYQVEHYNLDAIISVGYRVNSKRGTQFRQWATQRLKDYLIKGYSINNRINRLEDHLVGLTKKVDQIDLQINTKLIPTQGVYMDGQVFDAYELTSRIIRSAKQRIVLIDNYIDEQTFTQLAKKQPDVRVSILTKTSITGENKANKQLVLDLKKANEQYNNFEVIPFSKSHDRFLIIDHNEVYHLGASLKDLGKKWFAFTKLHEDSVKEL